MWFVIVVEIEVMLDGFVVTKGPLGSRKKFYSSQLLRVGGEYNPVGLFLLNVKVPATAFAHRSISHYRFPLDLFSITSVDC